VGLCQNVRQRLFGRKARSDWPPPLTIKACRSYTDGVKTQGFSATRKVYADYGPGQVELGRSAVCNSRDVNIDPIIENTPPQMRRWESAEIERSSVEARLTTDAALRVGPRTLARYAHPPVDTPYPLEYAYHLLGDDVSGLRIVDFGCGSGANSVHLANRGAHVWGVDISEDLIRLAERRMAATGRPGGARFIVASAHDLPFPDASIDIVFGIAILHHLDLTLVSREVRRVLRPGGRAIFQEPVRNSPTVKFVRSLIPYRAPDISPFERPLTDEELEQFAAPFASVRARAFGLPHVQLGQVLPVVKHNVAGLYRSDRALLRAVPALSYYAGIRVIEVIR
jgi:SAM-dependent methyltransferase